MKIKVSKQTKLRTHKLMREAEKIKNSLSKELQKDFSESLNNAIHHLGQAVNHLGTALEKA